MCGIVGYIGKRDSQHILLEGLRKLEYRGYDSAGIAVYTEKGLQIQKEKGRLDCLKNQLNANPLSGTVGIGHTRWATHGKPSRENAHPHYDQKTKFAIVHNGIIENHIALKKELSEKGYSFVSETDTEVIVHLLSDLYDGDIVQTVQAAVRKLEGAFALAVLCEHEPDKLVAVRQASPLIVGVGEGENYIGSDIPAILEHTRNVFVLDDGEMAVLTRDDVRLMTLEGVAISREIYRVQWDAVAAEKDGFPHFMLKEIHEQPKAYRNTMRGRLDTALNQITLEREFADDRRTNSRHPTNPYCCLWNSLPCRIGW